MRIVTALLVLSLATLFALPKDIIFGKCETYEPCYDDERPDDGPDSDEDPDFPAEPDDGPDGDGGYNGL